MDALYNFLKSAPTQGVYLLDTDIPLENFVPIDLSYRNKELENFAIGEPRFFERYIKSFLKANNAQVAYGGYLEERTLYQGRENFGYNTDNPRNIHLGIDFWCDAGTVVLVPMDGRVHSFRNNSKNGDYGPTIILEHSYRDVVFYSLYGHLSAESFLNIYINKSVKAGEKLGFLGTASVNGNYAPHLHFQLIRDIGNYIGDYPGVSSKADLEYYRHNCPDPNLLLNLNSFSNDERQG